MNKEQIFLEIINKTLYKHSLIGDDCAILDKYNIAISTDTLIEDVHFTLDTICPFSLGKKAALVNISDILASGAKPGYIFISLSGKLNEEFIREFYKGINEICNQYGVEVAGGDLTGGEKIAVTITILGDTANKNIASRKNAKPGYLVYLAGEHGSSAMGLKLLQEGEKNINNNFIKHHIEPELYPDTSLNLSENAKFEYAMMDTSDGLFDALNKISSASHVGFDIEYEKIPKQVDDFSLVMYGGEDYGLLICVNEKDAIYIKGAKYIGKVTSANKIMVDNKELKEDLSFEHFKD